MPLEKTSVQEEAVPLAWWLSETFGMLLKIDAGVHVTCLICIMIESRLTSPSHVVHIDEVTLD